MYRITTKNNNKYVTNVFDVDGSIILSTNINNAFYWESKKDAKQWFNSLGGKDAQVNYEEKEDNNEILTDKNVE